MKKKLKKELIRISTAIITSRELNEIGDIYEEAKNLYEKLAVLKFIEENLKDIEIDDSKNVVVAKFEKMANAVLDANTSIPENNPHKKDIITPGMDIIKDIVSEMSANAIQVEEVFAEFLAQPNFVKNDKEYFESEKLVKQKEAVKTRGTTPKASSLKSLNDKLTKEIKVDLNNKLAFVKHLFNDNIDDYNRVISQLNTIETAERSIAFIVNMVKPDYNNWEEKEEYETRFMELIERKFS